MILLLSPSKSMDMEAAPLSAATQPGFLEQSKTLASRLRKFSKSDLMEFMDISEKLARKNHRHFQDWRPPFTVQNAKQALFAFTGDVYDGLDASSLSPRELDFAQEHLRILSGLYGLLRPLDLIQPYRLEMGRPLQTDSAKNLYEFWRGAITEELNCTKGNLLVNLASNEYFKAVDKRALDKQIVSPIFKDERNGTLKIIGFHAKKARGAMARHLIRNRVADLEGIRAFASAGYVYDPELSTPVEPVFVRRELR